MQSVFVKALAGVCAAAFIAGGGAFAQSTSGAAAEPAEMPAESGTLPEQGQAQDAASQNQTTGGETAGTDTGAAESAPAGDFSADTVVATVSGTPITLGELIAVRRNLPAEFQRLPDEVLMSGLVEQLANQLLLAQAAREAGLDEKPAVRLALENQARSVLAGAYLAQQVNERVTDEAIEQSYQKQFVDAEPVEEAHAAHILVKDEATAKEIAAKLAEGADFAALAAEYGTDGTASRGGDLGWFTHDQMVPPFADAVFAMEPGTVSGPVKSPFGWHVIKLVEKRERPVPTLEEVRADIATQLADAARTEVMAGLREGIDMQIDDAAIPASAIRADELLPE